VQCDEGCEAHLHQCAGDELGLALPARPKQGQHGALPSLLRACRWHERWYSKVDFVFVRVH
jgi:hypothetical protein